MIYWNLSYKKVKELWDSKYVKDIIFFRGNGIKIKWDWGIIIKEKIRYWIANLFNLFEHTCWADLVMWVEKYEDYKLNNKTGFDCKIESLTSHTCYCGKFTDGKRTKKAEVKVS